MSHATIKAKIEKVRSVSISRKESDNIGNGVFTQQAIFVTLEDNTVVRIILQGSNFEIKEEGDG